MSGFHSTVSRRDFMKSLGLAGAGIGALSVAAPIFNDMDEVIGAPAGDLKRPWYVREKDTPAVDIDWSLMKRYDKRIFSTGDFQKINDETKELVLKLEGTTDIDEAHSKWAQANTPGMTLRDQALWNGTQISRSYEPKYTFLGPQKSKTPAILGVPKWDATPEENTRILRVAGRLFGAFTVGVAELNEQNIKIIWANNGKQDIVFEDVDEPYTTPEKYVVPRKCKYIFVADTRHGEHATKTAPGAIINSAQQIAYFTAAHMDARFQEFLRTLGYSCLGTSPAGSASWPVMTGVGELGRGADVITPEHGAMHRKFNFFFTDMPLAPTKPIDAGMNRFCYTCKKCGIQCPTSSIPVDTEPTWEGHGPWNNSGVKAWFLNYPTCGGKFDYKSTWGPGYCGMCMANCVFSKFDDANVHEIVKAVASTTSVFNAFFNNMDDTFQYGQNWRAHEKGDTYIEDWWNTMGPEFGYLTRTG